MDDRREVSGTWATYDPRGFPTHDELLAARRHMEAAMAFGRTWVDDDTGRRWVWQPSPDPIQLPDPSAEPVRRRWWPWRRRG